MSKRKVPLRMCVSCGEMKPKAQLIRIVKTPEGTVELDLTGRKKRPRSLYLPGEGLLRPSAKIGEAH